MGLNNRPVLGHEGGYNINLVKKKCQKAEGQGRAKLDYCWSGRGGEEKNGSLVDERGLVRSEKRVKGKGYQVGIKVYEATEWLDPEKKSVILRRSRCKRISDKTLG